MRLIRVVFTRFVSSSFFASSTIVFAGAFVINVLNYVFTLIMSRLLGVEPFGEVNALFSLLLITGVPAGALSMLMTREVAALGGERASAVQGLFIFLQKHVTLAAGIFWALFLVLTPMLSNFLHIPILPILIFSLTVPLSAAGALLTGTLQGLQEFFLIGKQGILSACLKLALSIGFVYAGFAVSGVMAAVVIAQAAAWAYGFVAMHAILSPMQSTEHSLNGPHLRATFSTILITTFLLALLSNIDVLLAKHYLSSFTAGEYAALSTIGKILLYGVGAFVGVLLPMASAAHARGQGEEHRLLFLVLGIIALSTLGACALFSTFPSLFVSILFGSRYAGIAPQIGIYMLAMGCIALTGAFINYFVAVRNTTFVYLLGTGIVAQVILLVYRHADLADFTRMVLYSSIILFVAMVGNYLHLRRSLNAHLARI